ncbi:hypothetical protein CN692_13405 [Bacillus sp. AFS002410]|uniref:minor capsid protein n=1 Tax=Bacillus sp. AFS002410 TaxID=2033481 RepID=UPI000BF0E189|nr:minor capsid protein [Bacillus sp. AFS002410]PEJ57405.1 hypothetical protein CN692_13405 [Bacillus sp. AFS002410]
MRSDKYWQQRTEERLSELYTDVDNFENDLRGHYTTALMEMQKEIAYFYSKYSIENGVPYKEAIKMLTGDDYRVWKRDITDYLEEIQSLVDNNNDKQANDVLKDLNALSIRSRINRLDGMIAKINVILGKLSLEEKRRTEDHLKRLYKDSYHKTMFDLFQGIEVGGSFAPVSDKLIRSTLEHPWSGANFSSRIWNNRDRLVQVLREELTQSMIQGKDLRKTSAIVAKRMDVSVKQAGVVVQTESAYIIEEASAKAYENSGVIEQYEILATLDNRTSQICQKQDGKIYNVVDRMTGSNYPPFHPRCRTTTIPVTRWHDEDRTRIARDLNGKTYYVPASMKYEEWYNTHVKE